MVENYVPVIKTAIIISVERYFGFEVVCCQKSQDQLIALEGSGKYWIWTIWVVFEYKLESFRSVETIVAILKDAGEKLHNGLVLHIDIKNWGYKPELV